MTRARQPARRWHAIDPGRVGPMLAVAALAACVPPAPEGDADPAAASASGPRAAGHEALLPTAAGASAPTAAGHEGLLYGRVTTRDGTIYEGRLRWGGDEEALWGNTFNGFRDVNPWVDDAPPEARTERRSIGAFGIEIAGWERAVELGRPFMARFGDIARIEPRGRDVRVTLKSGTVAELDRFSADDLADGVRVWDDRHGVVDLGEWQIRSIELLPGAGRGPTPAPLYGTVRTRHAHFRGLIQWNRQQALASDELHGRTAEGAVRLRFETIRSIVRRSRDSASVTLMDGRDIALSSAGQAGLGPRGIYVDDPRYGRVLVSWDAFERVDFGSGGTGPSYHDFPTGRPLTGTVVTRSGHRLAGRLVYDLDESETTETLDAPSEGVDYSIPFGLVASIALPDDGEAGHRHARVTLHSGETRLLEREGDLHDRNAGMLIFPDGRGRAEYVPWSEVEQVRFERPRATYPPIGLR